MKVAVLAFGIARDILGAASVDVELPPGATVGHLKAALEGRYPRLARLASYRVALGQAFADESAPVNGETEIALIPPVSGG